MSYTLDGPRVHQNGHRIRLPHVPRTNSIIGLAEVSNDRILPQMRRPGDRIFPEGGDILLRAPRDLYTVRSEVSLGPHALAPRIDFVHLGKHHVRRREVLEVLSRMGCDSRVGHRVAQLVRVSAVTPCR